MNETLPVKATLWRILIDPIEIQRYHEGGKIELPDSQIQAQEYLRYIGKVVDIGPLAFLADNFRDANGNLHRACEVGDWVIYGRHTGADIFVQGNEPGTIRSLRLVNDDQIMGIATDIDRVKIPLA